MPEERHTCSPEDSKLPADGEEWHPGDPDWCDACAAEGKYLDRGRMAPTMSHWEQMYRGTMEVVIDVAVKLTVQRDEARAMLRNYRRQRPTPPHKVHLRHNGYMSGIVCRATGS